jgi:hypothetical protein
MSLEEGIRKARRIDLTEEELHSTIKTLNEISNKIIRRDNMKTFLDVIKESNPNDVLKKYTVDGRELIFTAMKFQRLVHDSLLIIKPSYNYEIHETTFTGRMELLNSNVIRIVVTESCEYCNGGGEKDCELCSGTGETSCNECGQDETCEDCDGWGGVECDICGGEICEEDIIFQENIELNQGELFY